MKHQTKKYIFNISQQHLIRKEYFYCYFLNLYQNINGTQDFGTGMETQIYRCWSNGMLLQTGRAVNWSMVKKRQFHLNHLSTTEV